MYSTWEWRNSAWHGRQTITTVIKMQFCLNTSSNFTNSALSSSTGRNHEFLKNLQKNIDLFRWLPFQPGTKNWAQNTLSVGFLNYTLDFRGRNSLLTFFKLCTNMCYCNSLDKSIGKSNNIYPKIDFLWGPKEYLWTNHLLSHLINYGEKFGETSSPFVVF